jgi:hypothetical protein
MVYVMHICWQLVSRIRMKPLFLEWNSTCFRHFLCPPSGVSHCTHSNVICHTGLLTACEQDQDGTFILGMKVYMFWTFPPSAVRSFSLYTQQWYMSHKFADSLQAGSEWNAVPSWFCSQAISKPVWHITLLCIQWKTPDDGQKTCPKHVEFHSKNKYEKLVHLVGFIIRKIREKCL